MDRQTVERLLDEALADRRLLRHPFYLRWQRGELAPGELAGYAAQYRHYEAALPALLEGIAGDASGDSRAAELVVRNLADERGDAGPAHLELFESFARAVGAPAGAPATPATAALLGAHLRSAARGPAPGLAALAAYESQAPQIAASKAEGLRRHHGLDGPALRFWEVHAGTEADHAAWTVEALARLAEDPAEVAGAAHEAAEAWWGFLDERELARPRA